MYRLLDGPSEVMWLPTQIEKLSKMVWWPVVLAWSWMEVGALKCSFNLSLNVLEIYLMHSSSNPSLSHLYLYIAPPFCVILSLSFETYRRHPVVFQMNLDSNFATNVFETLTWSICVGYQHINVVVVAAVVAVSVALVVGGMGLCGVAYVVAFNATVVGVLLGYYTCVGPPLCIPIPYAVAVAWHKHSLPMCKVEYTILSR